MYKIYNAEGLLNKVFEHTGFITPLEGAKAMYISTIVGAEITNNSTAPMFIISADKETDYYMLLREFYLWYSYKMNLAGFDFETQEIMVLFPTLGNPTNPTSANILTSTFNSFISPSSPFSE